MSSKKKMPKVSPWLGKTLQVPVTGLDDHGQGVGLVEGRQVAVWGALPGDTVDAVVTWASPVSPWTRGTLTRVVTPSSHRTAAGCAHAPRCAGCPQVDLNPDEQRRHKRLRVVRALEQAGLSLPVEDVVAAPTQLGYRARAKYVVERQGDDVVLGAYGPHSHDVWPSHQCAVVHPLLRSAVDALRVLLQQAAALPRYVVVRTNGTQVLGCLVTTTPDGWEPLATAWRRACPTLAGVTRHLQADGGDAIFSSTPGATVTLEGAATISQDFSGVPVDVGTLAFTQLHPGAAQGLTRHVEGLLAPLSGRHILDAYCGLGAFSFALRAAARVHGVDQNAEAITSAQRAAAAHGLTHVAFEARDAAELLLDAHAFDTVVVDPPRKGIPAHARDALCAKGPATLVYVACEPQALARDLGPLCQAGYQVRRITPLDLFPATPEVETVVLLSR